MNCGFSGIQDSSQASVDSLIEVIACHDGRRFSISEQERYSRRGAGALSLADERIALRRLRIIGEISAPYQL